MKVVHWSKFNYEKRIVEGGVPSVKTLNLLSEGREKIEGVWCVVMNDELNEMWKQWVTVNRKSVVVYADVDKSKIVVMKSGVVVGSVSEFGDDELVEICKDSKNGLLVLGGIGKDEIDGVSLVVDIEWE